MWSCSCSWKPYSSYDKYVVLSVSTQSAQFSNPDNINCGSVVALGRHILYYSSSEKYGVLSVSAQSAQFPNPVYMKCGPVAALAQIDHF